MIAKICRITLGSSRNGGKVYTVLFKDDTGKNFISYIYPKCRNFARWRHVLDVGTVLSNLKLWRKDRNIIDADSKFIKVEKN